MTCCMEVVKVRNPADGCLPGSYQCEGEQGHVGVHWCDHGAGLTLLWLDSPDLPFYYQTVRPHRPGEFPRVFTPNPQ